MVATTHTPLARAETARSKRNLSGRVVLEGAESSLGQSFLPGELPRVLPA